MVWKFGSNLFKTNFLLIARSSVTSWKLIIDTLDTMNKIYVLAMQVHK